MIIYLLLVPLLVMLLARKWKWIDTISPMTVLYVIGLLVANLLPLSERQLATNSMVNELAVPIAIPLMLLGCNLKSWNTRVSVKTFLCGFFAVLIVTIAGFFLFRGNSSFRNFAQVCAVSAGIYTGGIPNIGAIAKGVGMDNETYLYVTSYDLIITGLYLVFVIVCGSKVYRRLLPKRETLPSQTLDVPDSGSASQDKPQPQALHSSDSEASHLESPDGASSRKATSFSWKSIVLIVLTTLLIALASYLFSTLFSPDHTVNMTLLILSLTTLSILASFLKPFKSQTQSFDMGLYCVYVFCLSIATSCNIHEMDLLGSLNILYYILFVVFGSIVLQILFSRLFHVDGDSALVCSVALINSPPFVPLVAALLRNKDVVILGISIGLLGYMLGNYLGIGLYQLLMFLGA